MNERRMKLGRKRWNAEEKGEVEEGRICLLPRLSVLSMSISHHGFGLAMTG